jgi:rhodanese-related sulfurtransferase
MKKYFIVLSILCLLWAASAQVTVLANSIDLGTAGNIAEALRASPEAVRTVSAAEFSSHKTDPIIFILGGQNSPEGVGEIVGAVLSEADKAYLLSSQDARRTFVYYDVWAKNQTVVVFAGNEKTQTRQILGETSYGLVAKAGSYVGTSFPPAYPPILPDGPFTEVDSFMAYSIVQSVPGLVIVDVRNEVDYAAGHLPGAVNMPEEKVSSMLSAFGKDKTYLLYCGGNSQSIRVGRIMHAVGFNKLYRLVGGYAAWRAAGYPKDG